MKLFIPFFGQPDSVDSRLIRLAEFLGIRCESYGLEKADQGCTTYLDNLFRERDGCFVVNPRVIKQWTGGFLPQELDSFLASNFRSLLVHNFTPDSFCQLLTRALSAESLYSIESIANCSRMYDVADRRDVCGAFSGIKFGPANSRNDYVFCTSGTAVPIQKLISVDGNALMTMVKRDKAEIFFLGSNDILDLDSHAGALTEHFSRFVPAAMALRYIFGEQCWHPSEQYASLIIDDPLLRARYGFLDFKALLNMVREYNFSTTVAFIPRNYKRNSKPIIEMFRANSDRLGMCFHGNDHTAGEFASTDVAQLNAMVSIAETRMHLHSKTSGLTCRKVMVFPQEKFSAEAMRVLKSHNFVAAVNASPSPASQQVSLTVKEIAQPALMRYAHFPLFSRKYVDEIRQEELAFNLFFGKPTLLVEHHGVFRQPDKLLDTVNMINSMAPEIRWCDVGRAVMGSNLRRITPDGICHVRAYSGTIRIANNWAKPRSFIVEWPQPEGASAINQVLRSGENCSFDVNGSTVRVGLDLAPHTSGTLSLDYSNNSPKANSLGFIWSAKAFVRRRLSEARDNYISKSPLAMNVAQGLQRRLLSRLL